MRRPSVLLSLLPALLTLSCLTMSHTKYLTDYSSPYREFDTRIDRGSFRVTRGISISEDRLTARFPGVLDGSGRVLQVERRGTDLVFSETAEMFAEGEPAVLVQQNVCCMDDEAFRKILFAKEGDPIRAFDILTRYFNQAPSDASALVVLDFANVYTVSSQLLCWTDKERIACTASLAPQAYTEAMKQIRWDTRSRFVYGAAHAWYLVTLPVDLVTLPFQAAALLLYGKGAAR